MALAAQSVAQHQAPCVFDSAAHKDTITMYIALGPSPDTATERRASYLQFGLAIADYFKPPRPLGLPGWPGTYDPHMTGNSTGIESAFGLAGILRFRVDPRTGRFKGHLSSSSGGQNLNEALEKAVKAADEAGRFGPLAEGAVKRDGNVDLYVREVFQPVADGVILMRVRFTAVRIDTSVSERHRAEIHYPAVAVAADAEGIQTFQFVVKEDGYMDTRTFRAVDATYIEFIDAARDAFERSSFNPAKVGACPVRSQVTWKINFFLTYRRDIRE